MQQIILSDWTLTVIHQKWFGKPRWGSQAHWRHLAGKKCPLGEASKEKNKCRRQADNIKAGGRGHCCLMESSSWIEGSLHGRASAPASHSSHFYAIDTTSSRTQGFVTAVILRFFILKVGVHTKPVGQPSVLEVRLRPVPLSTEPLH